MYINPWAWNQKANVIYLESPAGVGFSIAKSKADLLANDTTTAQDNLLALRLFFIKFPKFKRNDLYLTGESYAGIYIPTLARAILDFNEEADVDRILLKGIAVGNGCTHPSECGVEVNFYSRYQYEFLHRRGFISDDSWQDYWSRCALAWLDEECIAQQKRLKDEFIATGADIYNVFGKCYTQPKPSAYELKAQQGPGLRHTLRCSDSMGSLKLFNMNEYRDALHIGVLNDTLEWTTCSDVILH
jgi:serine carboxypeptidase-like clade 2